MLHAPGEDVTAYGVLCHRPFQRLDSRVIALTVYLIVINIVTFVAFCVDKRRAMRHEWRIPEKTLLGLSLVGGAFGGIVAMRAVHHKTRKPRFYLGLPLMLAGQVALIAWALS